MNAAKLLRRMLVVVALAALVAPDMARAQERAQAPGYGKLARSLVAPMFKRLLRKPAQCRADAARPECAAPALSDFSTGWMPHDAKALRKYGLGKMRDHLDVFAYAYGFDRNTDRWRSLRKQIDKGYEVMGKFKDLYDALPPAVRADPAQRDAVYAGMGDKIAARREAVVQWLAGFSDPQLVAQYQAHLESTDGEIHKRSAKKLSRFFWGAAEIVPKKRKSGVENISRLERRLLKLAGADLDELSTIEKVAQKMDGKKIPKDEELFHDFRKRIRTVVKLAGYFPEIRKTNSEGQPRAEAKLAKVAEAVSRLGEVQDSLISLHGKKGKKAKKLRKQINEDWAVLKEWLDDEKLDKALKGFRDVVKKG